MALVTALGGLIAKHASPGHVDLAMLPCSPTDPDMLWVLPPDGKEGQIIHQASELCLMSADCKVQTGAKGALVLDDCKSPCLTGHHVGMNADKWTVGGDPKQQLAIEAGTLHHYVVDASSSRFLGDPPIVLEPWNPKFHTNQQWTVSSGDGAGHTLTAGKAAGSGGYLPHCPTGPCCMGVHHDIVPDGDGGWSLVLLLFVGFALYAVGGVAYGKRRAASDGSRRDRLAACHPHYRQWMHVVGLCRDGWEFSRGVLQPARAWGRAPPVDRGGGLQRRAGKGVRKDKSKDSPNDEQAKSKREKQKHSGKEEKAKIKTKERQGDKRGELSEQLVHAAPAPAALGTTAGGGGRWVHVPN